MKQIGKNYNYFINNIGEHFTTSYRFVQSSCDMFSSKVIQAIEVRLLNQINYTRIFERTLSKDFVKNEISEDIRICETLKDDEILTLFSAIEKNKDALELFYDYLKHTRKEHLCIIEEKQEETKEQDKLKEKYWEHITSFLGTDEYEELVDNDDKHSKVNKFYCKQSINPTDGLYEKIIKVMIDGNWQTIYNCMYDFLEQKPIIDTEFRQKLDKKIIEIISSFISFNNILASDFQHFLKREEKEKSKKMQF